MTVVQQESSINFQDGKDLTSGEHESVQEMSSTILPLNLGKICAVVWKIWPDIGT